MGIIKACYNYREKIKKVTLKSKYKEQFGNKLYYFNVDVSYDAPISNKILNLEMQKVNIVYDTPENLHKQENEKIKKEIEKLKESEEYRIEESLDLLTGKHWLCDNKKIYYNAKHKNFDVIREAYRLIEDLLEETCKETKIDFETEILRENKF